MKVPMTGWCVNFLFCHLPFLQISTSNRELNVHCLPGFHLPNISSHDPSLFWIAMLKNGDWAFQISSIPTLPTLWKLANGWQPRLCQTWVIEIDMVVSLHTCRGNGYIIIFDKKGYSPPFVQLEGSLHTTTNCQWFTPQK